MEVDGSCCLFVVAQTLHNSNLCFSVSGSISNIDGDECSCSKSHVRKVISGVVGAASSVTSIQVANLLRLFRIPQVKIDFDLSRLYELWPCSLREVSTSGWRFNFRSELALCRKLQLLPRTLLDASQVFFSLQSSLINLISPFRVVIVFLLKFPGGMIKLMERNQM